MNPSVHATIAGVLIGAGAVFLKLFLEGLQFPIALASLVLGLVGGYLLQYSLKNQKMHVVASLSSGSSSLVSAVGGIALLQETLSLQEAAGIAFIIIGIVSLLYTGGKKRKQ
ncbi:MAG: hypothetical protein HYY37_03075 [Candidatus Aenigmarchaeota archaeon]|nr:hypothetical protein [Candidatus Aenigmarchaeota archaeon]